MPFSLGRDDSTRLHGIGHNHPTSAEWSTPIRLVPIPSRPHQVAGTNGRIRIASDWPPGHPVKKRNKTFSHQRPGHSVPSSWRYGAKGLCFLTSPGKLASGTLRRTMRVVSVPRAVQLSNHKLWPAIRPPATLVLGKASNPLCFFAMLFLASSITHITMDSKCYFPSFAADRRNGSLPQTKVSSSVGGVSSSCGSVPGRRLRTDGGFFSSAIDKQVKKKPLPKVAPLVSVLQEEALLLLLLLRTSSYIHTIGATSTGHPAGFLSSILAHNSQWYTTYKSSASALGPPRM